MTQLILINGAPGSGKLTLADHLAQDRAMTLALDVDWIKHSLGRWDDDPAGSGLHARRLALAMVREHMRAGYDVVIGQYLAKPTFIEQLEHLATELNVRFVEFILNVNATVLAERLAGRSNSPTRPEHQVNNSLVGPEDADHLVKSLEGLRRTRPTAIWIDADGSMTDALDLLRFYL